MKNRVEPAVVGHNVGYRYADGRELFRGLEFRFEPGIHGLVGSDTAIEATLARIIAGEIDPSEGSIKRAFSVERIVHLASPDTYNENAMIADELGIGREVRARQQVEQGATDMDLLAIVAEEWDLETRAVQALEDAGLAGRKLTDSCGDLEREERLRIRFARVQLKRPDLVIVDGPDRAMTESERDMLLHFVQNFATNRGKMMILVSHDRNLLREADHIWEISEFGLRSYGGNFDSYERSRTAELEEARKDLERAQAELDKRREAADDARERQMTRIERGRRFADTGLPKVHRGNLKRKSQETLSKLKSLHEQKIHEAEERVREALEYQERIELPDLVEEVVPPETYKH